MTGPIVSWLAAAAVCAAWARYSSDPVPPRKPGAPMLRIEAL